MSKDLRLNSAFAIVLLWTGTAARAATVPPGMVGYYNAVHLVTGASVSGGAGQCTNKQGDYYATSFYYPGPGKTGAADWYPYNLPGALGEFVSVFPATPAQGVTHWSGAYSIRNEPAATVVKGTFDSTTTQIDARSSIATQTITYPAQGGGTCTEMEQVNYNYSGK